MDLKLTAHAGMIGPVLFRNYPAQHLQFYNLIFYFHRVASVSCPNLRFSSGLHLVITDGS